MQSAISVNLVKNRKPRFFEKFTSWALTAGRIVVIVTELIALGAFLYRFGLDRQLSDLHDKITQEQNIVKFLKKNEDTYRNLQDRLSLAATIIKMQGQTLSVYQGVQNLFPADMTITTLSYSPSTMHIQGSIQSIASLTKFIDALKNYPQVDSISLDKITNKTTTATTDISIGITFKQSPNTLL